MLFFVFQRMRGCQDTLACGAQLEIPLERSEHDKQCAPYHDRSYYQEWKLPFELELIFLYSALWDDPFVFWENVLFSLLVKSQLADS